MTETQKETLWKINDFQQLMETRISEQKVKDMVRQLDLRFTEDLKLTNDSILGKFKQEIQKMDDNVNNHFTFAEMKAKDNDAKCEILSQKISSTVQNITFQEQCEKLTNLKQMVEDEMDMIGTHIRNAKDLQGELLAKFELAIKSGVSEVSP